MKNILTIIFLFLFGFSSYAQNYTVDYIEIFGNTIEDIKKINPLVEANVYLSAIDLSGLETSNKKQSFINLMLPSILIAKYEIENSRNLAVEIISKKDLATAEEIDYLSDLKRTYKCNNDTDLLSKLQTHPTSIVLGQAALESGWGTSRFYREANNVFGVWSYSINEPRIRASVDREGASVFVRRYASLPESIQSYFKTIARGPYSLFRTEREKTKDVYQLTPYLKVYSELKEEYVSRLEKLIRYNRLEQYDSYILKLKDRE